MLLFEYGLRGFIRETGKRIKVYCNERARHQCHELCLQAQSVLGELIFSVSNSSELLSSLQYRGLNVTDTQLLFSDVGSGAVLLA